MRALAACSRHGCAATAHCRSSSAPEQAHAPRPRRPGGITACNPSSTPQRGTACALRCARDARNAPRLLVAPRRAERTPAAPAAVVQRSCCMRLGRAASSCRAVLLTPSRMVCRSGGRQLCHRVCFWNRHRGHGLHDVLHLRSAALSLSSLRGLASSLLVPCLTRSSISHRSPCHHRSHALHRRRCQELQK